MLLAPQPHRGPMAAPNTLGILLLQFTTQLRLRTVLARGCALCRVALCPQLWLCGSAVLLSAFFCSHPLAPSAPVGAALSPATSFSAYASYFETIPLTPALRRTAPALCTLAQAWYSTALTTVPFPGRGTLGTRARMVPRVPGVMLAPLECLERG